MSKLSTTMFHASATRQFSLSSSNNLSGFHAAIAAAGLPAPKTLVYDIGLMLQETSLDHLWAEHLFAFMAGVAITSHHCQPATAVLYPLPNLV